MKSKDAFLMIAGNQRNRKNYLMTLEGCESVHTLFKKVTTETSHDLRVGEVARSLAFRLDKASDGAFPSLCVTAGNAASYRATLKRIEKLSECRGVELEIAVQIQVGEE